MDFRICGNDKEMKSSAVLPRLLEFDLTLIPHPHARLAGVDEVGRGPLAGPVVAAAVIFRRSGNFSENFAGLNDSKKVTPENRERLFREIIKHSFVGLGIVDEATIDLINIYQASRLAMKRAVLDLTCTPDLLMIDGNARLDLPLAQKTIVKGDSKSASIAAASIVAKVYRDHWMLHLDEVYPGYQFKDHKGYGTPGHLKCIEEQGPCEVHRRSFAPIKNFPDFKRQTLEA